MVKVAVVGAAGYTGIEAVRWILGHPRLELVAATSGNDAGTRVGAVYPALASSTDLSFIAPDPETIASLADVAVLAVPHTAAMSIAPRLLDAGLTVIDMSADFRFADREIYEAWYGTPHTASALLGESVYGLPELDRSGLQGARLVGCAGCYVTATVLAGLPALAAGITTSDRVIVDAKSGVSGAGRSATAGTHFCSADEAFAPYKVASHRHTPEMEQALGSVAGRGVSVMFAPHLVPMSRGLLSSVYLEVGSNMSTADALDVYRSHFAGEPFVNVCEEGVFPSTADVRGSNRASIGVTVDRRTGTLIATCAIDNLGKGAAGQAIQCLNAALGFPETEGLLIPGPVV